MHSMRQPHGQMQRMGSSIRNRMRKKIEMNQEKMMSGEKMMSAGAGGAGEGEQRRVVV